MLIPLGILAASGGVVGDYELIESAILTSNESSVTFSNLGTYSSTYKHLQIRYTARSLRNVDQDFPVLRFNGDDTASYAWHRLDGNGSSVSSAAGTSQTSIALFNMPDAQSATSVFSGTVIDILDPYSTTKNTTIRSLVGWIGFYNRIALTSGVYLKTDSITSISIIPSNANLASGSRFSIYGVRG